MRMLDRIRGSETEDPAFDEYLSACESYYRRQLLMDEHSPQQAYGSPEEEPQARLIDLNN